MWNKFKELALSALIASWAFLAPIHGCLLAVGMLLLFDWITGIAKALKAKEPITSRWWRATIGKASAYGIAVLTGFFLDNSISLDVAARAFTAAIAITEAKSIAENLKVLTGIDLWAAVADKLKPQPPSPPPAP